MMTTGMVSTRSFPMIEVILFCCLASLLVSGTLATCPEAIVIRKITNQGFHRDLVSHVILDGLNGPLDGCQVMFKEKFPSGLYLDPYQLASLQQHNLTEALISGTVDIEAPEYVSAGHTAFIFAKPDPAACNECFKAEVPMHIRYHKPSGKRENALVTLKKPQLLIRCSTDFLLENCREYLEVKAPCTVKDQTVCKWRNLKYRQVPEVMSLQVPVGIQQHSVIVCALTLLVTVLCSGLLLAAVYKHGDF